MLAGVGYAEIDDNHALEQRGVVTSAAVVHKDDDARAGSSIKIRFRAQAGRTAEVAIDVQGDAEVGQTLEVVYDPTDPTRVHPTDQGYDDRTPLLVFGGASLAMLCVALTRFWSRP